MSDPDFRQAFDRAIQDLFREAVTKFWRSPRTARTFCRILLHQRRAVKRRLALERQGLIVPAVMIVSVTRTCNLNCVGCYARLLRSDSDASITGSGELSPDRVRSLLAEARELGVSVVFLAGGEPLLRRDILEVASGFPDIVFPLFTNGTLVNDEWGSFLKRHPNIVPVLSLEGLPEDTEDRRGRGILARIGRAIDVFRRQKLFWAVSFTVTSMNFSVVVNRAFLEGLIKLGGRAFFFVEYVPIQEDSQGLVMTEEQKREMLRLVSEFRRRVRALFVMLPGDETEFGGCLAAGRGFIHVNSSGDVEPCPFAPYSDSAIRDSTLREALNSELLRKIRERHGDLQETTGGCALWRERDWVQGLLSEKQAKSSKKKS
jgi:MoaA/NifB/PqqE/SkfB family radical SAM enzyme